MKILKKIIEKIFYMGNSRIYREFALYFKNNTIAPISQIEQRRLHFYYRNLIDDNKRLPVISDTGFRVFSQTDEDGILLYIFSIIGTTNKVCIDIAFASPFGANTTNLICNCGWFGLLVCGSKREQNVSKSFFKKDLDTFIYPPKIVNEWITSENINEVILNSGISCEIDFLSLDIDGVDFWIWKKLDAVSPRVIVIEFNYVLGYEKSITIPYKSNFSRKDIFDDYYGASIKAFIKLADERGYRLVAFNKDYFNAFFIKKDLALGFLPTLSLDDYRSFYSKRSLILEDHKKRYEKIKNLPWIDV